MLSEAGLIDQTGRATALRGNLIDQFYFISSKENDGIDEFLQGINDRRLEQMKEDQEDEASIRHDSRQSIRT